MSPIRESSMSAMKLQSALLRGADTAARALGLLDRPFDPDGLIAAARRKTGLHSFGDEGFRAPLDVLLRACAAEATPSVVGRATIRWDTVRLLTNLLRFQRAEDQAPDILREPVERPVFITGLPRSGTTFLHKLMMLDAANQVPRIWQTIHPYPAGGAARGRGRDSRIRDVDRQLRMFERLAPEFRAMHPVDASSPQECSEIMAHVFASLRFDTTYRVPSYRRWLDGVGHVEAYRFHRRFLQHLQFRLEPRQWVLKCPDHVFALPAIRAVYPGARLIFVHRDPAKVLPSLTRLTEVLRGPFTRRIDRLEIGRQESERWLEGTRHMIQAAEADRSGQSTAHVLYSDLIADPLATVESLYARLGLRLPGAAADRIRQSTTDEPSGGYGVNRYRLEDYGLDPIVERDKFAEYVEYFSIAPEPGASAPGPPSSAR
jgi:hypothetical protein